MSTKKSSTSPCKRRRALRCRGTTLIGQSLLQKLGQDGRKNGTPAAYCGDLSPLKCLMTAASRNGVDILSDDNLIPPFRSQARFKPQLRLRRTTPQLSARFRLNHRCTMNEPRNSLCQPIVLLLLFIAFPLYVVCSLSHSCCILHFLDNKKSLSSLESRDDRL